MPSSHSAHAERTSRRFGPASARGAASFAGAVLSLGLVASAGGSAAAEPAEEMGSGSEALSIAIPRNATIPLAPGVAPVDPQRAFNAATAVAQFKAASVKAIEQAQAAERAQKARAEKAKREQAAKAKREQAAKAAGSARGSQTASRSAARTSGSPKAIARSMVSARGWGAAQFRCLDNLWEKESNWRPTAANPSSGAYGIPQSLPGSKMASHGSDWRTNPATQIAWGLDYIAGRYGTPCSAWAHSRANNWY